MSTHDLQKDERVLLIATNLSTGGAKEFQAVYEWLDKNAVLLANQYLAPHYRQLATLAGDDVTSSNFVDRLVSLTQMPGIRAVDVVVVIHGLPGQLLFDDGLISSAELGSRLRAARLNDRLRLLYSLACFGATHAQDFVAAGFRVASGALGVNANGIYDFPAQLHRWSSGATYKAAVAAGNNPIGIATSDFLAAHLGFTEVKSEKIVTGRVLTRITTAAD